MLSPDDQAMARVHHQLCCAAAVSVLAESISLENPEVDARNEVSPQAPEPVSNAVQLLGCFVAFKAWL